MKISTASGALILTVAVITACAPGLAGRRILGTAPPAFTMVALGTAGGLDEQNLTSFLLGPPDGSSYVALDAGTLYRGLQRAIRRGSFANTAVPATSTLTLAGHILRDRIRAVLISHPHLDHLAGLVIASPDDGPKDLFALPQTHDALRDSVWNGRLWVNFTNEGPGALGKLRVQRMEPGVSVPVPGTPLRVQAFPLSHGTLTSTAFLVEHGGQYALYLGDTGPDRVEGQGRLATLWTHVAPLIRERRLRAIFLECSFPDPRPDKLLFGHLTPSHLMEELRALAMKVDPVRPDRALRGVTVVVTHIKPTLEQGTDPRAVIEAQLAPLAKQLRVLLPEPGARYDF